ncbi:MAG: hypothetical protein HC767_10370 [Akkermansiaceae bacterium]|nr:hypothetical protein [Akkermansiaceae bacterium]
MHRHTAAARHEADDRLARQRLAALPEANDLLVAPGDTHAGPSNLHYGFDNWIYGSVGYAGFRGESAVSVFLDGSGSAVFFPLPVST